MLAPRQSEQADTGSHVHQEVDITIARVLSAGHAAEDPDVGQPVRGGNLLNLTAMPPKAQPERTA